MPDSRKAPFHPLIGKLDLRLRLLQAARDLGVVAAAAALALLLPRLTGDGMPGLAVAALAVGLGVAAFRFATGSSFARAAAAGDRRGELQDELASAQWFSTRSSPTEWEALQIARAARRAGRLDAAELFPFRVPGKTFAAAGVLAGLALVLPLFDGPLLSEEFRARLAESLAAAPDEGEDAGGGDDGGEDTADARVETRSPEEILAELRAGELRLPDEPALDPAAMEAALAAAMEERAFEASSAEVSAALAGLAEAMDAAADAALAAEWMASLEEALRNASTPEELAALLEALEAGGEGDPLAAAAAEMMEMMEAGMSAEEALEQLAGNMQGMDGQQMNAPGQGEAQQMPFPGDGEGGGQPQAGEGGEPAGGMPQGAAGLSGQVQMVAAEGQMGAPIPLDAGPAGNMTGPGGGGESEVFGAATSLEVQLEMEMIPAPLEEEPLPEQMIERQSRREDATVAYDSVQSLAAYAEETVSRGQPIPTGLRPLVRAYFNRIRETAAALAEAAEPGGGERP